MSDSRKHAHELIDELDAYQLAAIGCLLEVMIHDDKEELTEADRAAIRAGLASLDKNGGVPMEEIIADFGLTMAEFETTAAGSPPNSPCLKWPGRSETCPTRLQNVDPPWWGRSPTCQSRS